MLREFGPSVDVKLKGQAGDQEFKAVEGDDAEQFVRLVLFLRGYTASGILFLSACRDGLLALLRR